MSKESTLSPEEKAARKAEYFRQYHLKNAEKKRAAAKAWYEANRERGREARHMYREARKDQINAKRRAEYAANPTKVLDQCKSYRERHREVVLARKREHHQANKPRLNEISRAWHHANKEYVAEYKRRRRAEVPEVSRAARARRRARKRAAGGSHSAKDVRALFASQRGRCAVCRRGLGTAYDVDHVTPLARGGSNCRRNLQLLCGTCNRSKGSRDPIEFMQSRGFLL